MASLPKTKEDWITAVKHQLWIKVLLFILSGCCTYILAQAPAFVKEKVIEIVKPGMDSLAHKQEITDKKVDALITILRKAFPQVEQAAKEKAADDAADVAVKQSLVGSP